MSFSLILLLWTFQASIIAFIGSKRKIGAFWSFLIAFLIGPLFGIIAVLISKKKHDLEVIFPDLNSEDNNEKGLSKEMLKELTELERLYRNKEIDEATYTEAKKRIQEQG